MTNISEHRNSIGKFENRKGNMTKHMKYKHRECISTVDWKLNLSDKFSSACRLLIILTLIVGTVEHNLNCRNNFFKDPTIDATIDATDKRHNYNLENLPLFVQDKQRKHYTVRDSTPGTAQFCTLGTVQYREVQHSTANDALDKGNNYKRQNSSHCVQEKQREHNTVKNSAPGTVQHCTLGAVQYREVQHSTANDVTDKGNNYKLQNLSHCVQKKQREHIIVKDSAPGAVQHCTLGAVQYREVQHSTVYEDSDKGINNKLQNSPQFWQENVREYNSQWSRNPDAVLYCTVLYCTPGTVQYSGVLYSTVLNGSGHSNPEGLVVQNKWFISSREK